MKILLIDDSKIYTLLIKKFLEGHNVEVFESYEEAKLAGFDNFECILIDYLLADGVTSIDCILDIRKKYLFIPIIVVTASQDARVIIENLKAGANDYISKQSLDAKKLNEIIVKNIQDGLEYKNNINYKLKEIKRLEQKILNNDN